MSVLLAEHAASFGLGLDIDTSHHDVAGALVAWSRQREVSVADAAPRLIHADLVMGVRTLTTVHRWSAAELKSISFLLFDVHALTLDETKWLAGYVADDAPMAPVSPQSD